MKELTDRQREVLAVVIELTDTRQAAETMGVAYVTLRNHIEEIKKRLNLEDHFIEFGGVAIGDPFVYQRMRYTRVDYAMDRFGGYNAQNSKGERRLFFHHTIVERISE